MGKMAPVASMIDSPAALAEVVGYCHRLDSIALDTEFVWERTYYPRLGLVQVAAQAGECWLVDAVALRDLTPLAALLEAPQVTKVLHDAPQDLTILRRATGAYPARVYDTRCAAALAGLSSTTSLAELVAATVGVQLAKTESRTNWVQRPLSSEQVQYAAEDVCYLHAVRCELQRRVAALGRAEWVEQELAGMAEPSLYDERDPHIQYQRLKGAGRLSRRELAVLRELAAWREEEARRRDRPRRRVVEDHVLLDLARRQPRSPAARSTSRSRRRFRSRTR
jgi:ribonuclease D